MKADGSKRRELHAIVNSSATLVVNKNEKKYLEEILPSAPVFNVGLIYGLHDEIESWEKRRGLTFVGSSQHPPNIDALSWFLDEVWPLIDEEIRSEGFQIIGANLEKSVGRPKQYGVNFLGYVPDTTQYLQKARISVAPLRFGAGSKGKVCEAWACGLPVVGPSVALSGMAEESSHALLAGDSSLQFASEINRIYKNKELWETASCAAQDLIRERYTIELARTQIKEMITFVTSRFPR